jgi:predicted esterase
LSDGVQRAGSRQHCLVIRRFEPPAGSAARAPVLVAFLHGDSGGNVELLADSGAAFSLAQQLNLSAIALQRPGYRSSLGLSDGLAGNDDYTAGNVMIVAAALDRLRTLAGKKIVLVGHAGGAAMAALVASRFPASADAFLLVACPCDVPQWQQWRSASTGTAERQTQSLSPQAEAAKTSAGTRIALLVGSKDDAMPSRFSEGYAAALQRQGVKTRLTYAMGATHVSVLRAPEFFMLIQELVTNLSK